jgi:hypothetical protein
LGSGPRLESDPLQRELLGPGLAIVEHLQTSLAAEEREHLKAQAAGLSLDALAA